MLRLTLLAPEIVEAILDGRQPAELQLDDLLAGIPLEWALQRMLREAKSDRLDSGPPRAPARATSPRDTED